MGEILIISDHLLMAGAERLIYELVRFAQQNNLTPTVLIVNNYSMEYYDDILKNMGVKVVRTTIGSTSRLKSPVNIAKSLYWQIKLKYFAKAAYESIHVIGLYNVPKIINDVVHSHRFYWHVTNSSQYFNEEFDYPEHIFQNPDDTIVYINSYQIDEIHDQYGSQAVKCKTSLFKLFVADE